VIELGVCAVLLKPAGAAGDVEIVVLGVLRTPSPRAFVADTSKT
jgi:hypothetical protein